ncbi:MAG: hypothetical protein AAF557_24975 [Pseudomonadota bacterium]
MMLAAMMLFDMVLLALEIWLSEVWLAMTGVLCAVFIAIRVVLGTTWMVNVALGVAGTSALFILSQAGVSAWGANLMLYLLPIQIANAAAVMLAFFVGSLWSYRS